jgi:hypothetical protein
MASDNCLTCLVVVFHDLGKRTADDSPLYGTGFYEYYGDPERDFMLYKAGDLVEACRRVRFSFDVPTDPESVENHGVGLDVLARSTLTDQINPIGALARDSIDIWSGKLYCMKGRTWNELKGIMTDAFGTLDALEIFGLDLLGKMKRKDGVLFWGDAPYVQFGVIHISKPYWLFFLTRIIDALSIKKELVSSKLAHIVSRFCDGNIHIKMTGVWLGKYYTQYGYCDPNSNDVMIFLFHQYLEFVNKILVDNPSLLQV